MRPSNKRNSYWQGFECLHWKMWLFNIFPKELLTINSASNHCINIQDLLFSSREFFLQISLHLQLYSQLILAKELSLFLKIQYLKLCSEHIQRMTKNSKELFLKHCSLSRYQENILLSNLHYTRCSNGSKHQPYNSK